MNDCFVTILESDPGGNKIDDIDTSDLFGSIAFSSYLLLENTLTPILCRSDETGITANPVNYREAPPKSEQRDSVNSRGPFELLGSGTFLSSFASEPPLSTLLFLKRANIA